MANIYVRSTDGSDADNGSTWALAKATAAGAAAIEAAGDTINLSSVHAESVAAAITLALAGTNANPVRVLSVSDAAQPPTTLAAGASLATTGTNNITVHGPAYVEGLSLTAGSGAANAVLILNPYNTAPNSRQVYEECSLVSGGSGASARVSINSSGSASTNQDNDTLLSNCKYRSSTSNGAVLHAIGRLEIRGGEYLSGGASTLNSLVYASNYAGRSLICRASGVDLTNAPAGISIFGASSAQSDCVARNIRLPASWSGSLVTGTIGIGDRFAMHNCDSGDTNYRLWTETYYGTVRDETTIVRTGGASDGTTPIAWRMQSNANAAYPFAPLESPEITRRYPGTAAEEAAWSPGASVTVTIEVITDGVTLKDDECWLEAQCLGTLGAPLGVFASDAKSDVLAAAANQTSSSEAWTTTGMTTPTKQKLSVTITPQEKGVIHAVVKLAKASTTVYVDLKQVLS